MSSSNAWAGQVDGKTVAATISRAVLRNCGNGYEVNRTELCNLDNLRRQVEKEFGEVLPQPIWDWLVESFGYMEESLEEAEDFLDSCRSRLEFYRMGRTSAESGLKPRRIGRRNPTRKGRRYAKAFKERQALWAAVNTIRAVWPAGAPRAAGRTKDGPSWRQVLSMLRAASDGPHGLPPDVIPDTPKTLQMRYMRAEREFTLASDGTAPAITLQELLEALGPEGDIDTADYVNYYWAGMVLVFGYKVPSDRFVRRPKKPARGGRKKPE